MPILSGTLASQFNDLRLPYVVCAGGSFFVMLALVVHIFLDKRRICKLSPILNV